MAEKRIAPRRRRWEMSAGHGLGPMSVIGEMTNQIGVVSRMFGSSVFCLGLFVAVLGA